MAEQRFAEIVDIAGDKGGDLAVAAHAMGSRIAALARLGRFEESLALMPRALELAEASGATIKIADVNMLVGAALMDMGHGELGLRYVTYGRDKAISIDGRECATAGHMLVGLGEMARMQLVPAIESLDRSEQMAIGTMMESHLYNQRAARAACRYKSGDVTAMEQIQAQLARAEAMQDGFGKAMAAMFLAESLVAAGRASDAVPHVAGALEWYRSRAMKPYVVRALRTLATADEALGRTAEASAARVEASRLEGTLAEVDPSFLGEPGTPRAFEAVA